MLLNKFIVSKEFSCKLNAELFDVLVANFESYLLLCNVSYIEHFTRKI